MIGRMEIELHVVLDIDSIGLISIEHKHAALLGTYVKSVRTAKGTVYSPIRAMATSLLFAYYSILSLAVPDSSPSSNWSHSLSRKTILQVRVSGS